MNEHMAILSFLANHQGHWATHSDSCDGGMPTVKDVLPDVSHDSRLAKMKELYASGYVQGCPCGCRGDWEITNKGLALIGQKRTGTTVPRIKDGAWYVECPASIEGREVVGAAVKDAGAGHDSELVITYAKPSAEE